MIGDILSSTVAWLAYTYMRYTFNPQLMLQQGYRSFSMYLQSPLVLLGILVFPLLMMFIYYLSGYYNEVFRKSRVQELFTTIVSVVVNCLLIFFIALVNDMANDRIYNYEMILLLFAMLFVLVYAVRICITTQSSKMIKNRLWQFNTIVIGTDEEALRLGNNLNTMPHSTGNHVLGYVAINNTDKRCTPPEITYEMQDIGEICRKHDIKELIVSLSGKPNNVVLEIINRLFILNLPIKVTPSLADIVLSKVKVEQLSGELLYDVSGCSMSDCAMNIKRMVDVMVSGLCLVVLSPLYVLLALLIKFDSKGEIVYKQERIGRHNKPFKIYKFRSMVANAESDAVPQLTCDNDARVTKVGRWMRKYRLDETLQFWNVLKGDMSLVGPRPEREYFIRQIMERVPYYAMLHKVRPGITSLGMVKYGYAKDVDEMIERLKYDLLYLENMSLVNDFKIMIYTVLIVINGRGI